MQTAINKGPLSSSFVLRSADCRGLCGKQMEGRDGPEPEDVDHQGTRAADQDQNAVESSGELDCSRSRGFPSGWRRPPGVSKKRKQR
ncbi:hypothetical protein NDU88_010030 [Pleurodeles waltl]|uniref:Uncharacterized protein n=1 Tax=Pleurodeles waltl TaxID=8319 RepID=A0AAV7PWS7_PLEWA|nr:hypothetical protein NDU88_010030 [Pleurodeles waltl]